MTPEGWKLAPVAALFELQLGKMLNKQASERTPQFPYLGNREVQWGRFNLSDLRQMYFSDNERMKFSLRHGDLLVCEGGEVGRTALWKGEFECYFQKALHRLRPLDSKIVPSFMLQFMRFAADTGALADFTSQSSIAHLTREKLARLQVLLPPLPEQRKIAAILSSVDDAIDKTEAVINQLGVVKKAMMQELLTKGLPGRHTKYKKTEIGMVPEEWATTNIGEACDIHNNLRLPIKVADREKMAGPYPYYGPTKALSYINEYRFDGEYCLIGEDGDHFLKFDQWPMTQLVRGRFNVNNHAHALVGRTGCLTEWVFNYFKHRDITPRLTRQGANRYKLTKATLLQLALPLPTLKEQAAICKTLASVEDRIASEKKLIVQGQGLKSALMSVLLTGEVRVTADEDAA